MKKGKKPPPKATHAKAGNPAPATLAEKNAAEHRRRLAEFKKKQKAKKAERDREFAELPDELKNIHSNLKFADLGIYPDGEAERLAVDLADLMFRAALPPHLHRNGKLDMMEAAEMVGLHNEIPGQIERRQFAPIACRPDHIDKQVGIARARQDMVSHFQLADDPGQDRSAVEHHPVQHFVVDGPWRPQGGYAPSQVDVPHDQKGPDNQREKPDAAQQRKHRTPSAGSGHWWGSGIRHARVSTGYEPTMKYRRPAWSRNMIVT